MKILECSNLTKKYRNSEVVSNLSFSVCKGEVLGLLGPNGAGKTTTIKMILGLTSVNSGKVYMEKGIRIGYSPETPYFHPFLSGYEVMQFFSRLQGINKAEADRQTGEFLEVTGLENASGKKVRNYSKGMLQRLAIAQALLGDPELLILDEPTSSLDVIGRIEIIQLIKDLKQKGKTIILNTHILNDMEKVADRTLFIVGGQYAGEMDASNFRNGGLENQFLKIVGGYKHDRIDSEYIQGKNIS